MRLRLPPSHARARRACGAAHVLRPRHNHARQASLQGARSEASTTATFDLPKVDVPRVPNLAGGAAMLMQPVESYLAVRRAAGFQLRKQSYLLRSFARFRSSQESLVAPTASVGHLVITPNGSAPRYRDRYANYAACEDKPLTSSGKATPAVPSFPGGSQITVGFL
jgi:hypothetical protein